MAQTTTLETDVPETIAEFSRFKCSSIYLFGKYRYIVTSDKDN